MTYKSRQAFIAYQTVDFKCFYPNDDDLTSALTIGLVGQVLKWAR